MSLLELSVSEVIGAFRAVQISPVELIDAVLRQIERVEPELNAFVVRASAERLREQAGGAEERWRRGEPLGPLDGVPITIKDAILARGWPMRSGSLQTSSQPCDADAPAVARAREAGALLLGKTTTPEFGWKAVTDGPLTGISRNPWDLAMTPGGSSGGAAAAVAAGAAFASIGTDAGGSVRIPGAFCGLVALKATRGRIPAFPPSSVWTAGHIGPIARTVQDVALLLDIMAAPDARDWNALPAPCESFAAAFADGSDITGLRVAYSPTFGQAKVEPEVRGAVAAAAARFAELGARVEEVEAPLPDARDAFLTYFRTGIAHALRHIPESDWGSLDPGLAAALAAARSISREDFLDAYDFQIRISREARLFNERFDILLSPTVAVAPFAAGALSPDGYDPENWLEWSPFTYPFNLSGQPAITLNCGFTKGGLPIGLQLVGPMHGEALLLRAAHAYEASVPFPKRLPPCLARSE